MKSMPISVFKAKCLGLVEDMQRSQESIEVTKRGRVVAIVNPPPRDQIDWTPGAFGSEMKITGNIECDLVDLGVEFEAL